MTDSTNDILDKIDSEKPRKCDKGCRYYMFDHLNCACLFSEWFSVNKGEMCFVYDEREKEK